MLESEFGVIALGALAAALATALLIYLTPLKYVNLVPPVMNEMGPTEFHQRFNENPDEYVFIDVRSPNIYNSAHAKGSVNIPIESLYDEHYALPRSGKKIVLICTTGRLAAVAYGYLKYQGFNNLLHIQGGMVNWANQGLPLEGRTVFSASAPSEYRPDDGHDPSDEHQ